MTTGKIDGPELEGLRQQIYGDGKIDRPKADFLVELHKRVRHLTPAFEHFFYQAIKGHILPDGQRRMWNRNWGGRTMRGGPDERRIGRPRRSQLASRCQRGIPSDREHRLRRVSAAARDCYMAAVFRCWQCMR